MSEPTTQAIGPNQELWLGQLKSGEHPQCKEKLFDGLGYCCLGILERFVCKIEPELKSGYYYFNGSRDWAESTAIEAVRLRTSNGDIAERFAEQFFSTLRFAGYSGERCTSLAVYNDLGATFAQLAAAMRACPEAVFGGTA